METYLVGDILLSVLVLISTALIYWRINRVASDLADTIGVVADRVTKLEGKMRRARSPKPDNEQG